MKEKESKFKIGDKVIITENVQFNHDGGNIEGTVIEIEHNPFKGIVIAAETLDKGIFFDREEYFIKL